MNTSRSTFNLVIGFLGAALLLCLLGVVVVVLRDREIPSLLQEVAVGALTGLAGMLTHPPSDSGAQPVQVVNSDAQPVPVDPQPEPPVALRAGRVATGSKVAGA